MSKYLLYISVFACTLFISTPLISSAQIGRPLKESDVKLLYNNKRLFQRGSKGPKGERGKSGTRGRNGKDGKDGKSHHIDTVSGQVDFTFITQPVSGSGQWRAVILAPDGSSFTGPMMDAQSPQTQISIGIGPSIYFTDYTILFVNESMNLSGNFIEKISISSTLHDYTTTISPDTTSASTPKSTVQFVFKPFNSI